MYILRMTKDTMISIRIGALDRARLDAIAGHLEMSVSAVVRMLAKREVETLGLKVKGRRGSK
jgi:antitoxin component of RelBE/YafQ-DinJ toxin-antitoxin module